jgi:tetratricopeptide (TPR) repeat protein
MGSGEMKRRHILSTVFIIIVSVRSDNSALEYYRYFSAMYNQYRNNIDSARNWYDKLLANSMPVHAYKGYIELLFTQGKHAAITQLMPYIQKILNANPDMQHICAHALARTGKVKESDELLIRAAQQHKTHQEIIFYAAQTYMRRKEPENALMIIDTLLNSTPRMPSHYAFYFLKSHIYTSLNQVDSAIDALHKCVTINPGFHKAKFMLTVLNNKKENLTTPGRSRVHTLQILAHAGKYEQVFKHLTEWITNEPNNQLWYEYLYQLTQKIDPEKIITFLHTHDNPYAHAYLGLLYLQTNNLSQSLEYLHNAFTQSSDIKLKTKLALQQARIYYEQKEYNKMITILEKGYELDQNYAPLLNMLAYSYAKQNKNLDKALNLIDRVLENNTDNPYYRDTKAVVLYAKGEYSKAQKILEPLVEQVPTDTTILNHLSKVFSKQGMHKDAQVIAQRAYSVAKTSDEKQKWEQRIKELR